MITYQQSEQGTIVKLDGKTVGLIRHTEQGWAYYPKGVSKQRGEFMEQEWQVRNSLANEHIEV